MKTEERIYGIQTFDTPEEAFGLMASSWSNRDEENMQILNNRQFCRIIGDRIIQIVVKTMLASFKGKMQGKSWPRTKDQRLSFGFQLLLVFVKQSTILYFINGVQRRLLLPLV